MAVLVGEDLGLDMPWVIKVSLHETFPATKGGNRLADSGVKKLWDFVEIAGHLHAPPTPTKGRLDGDR